MKYISFILSVDSMLQFKSHISSFLLLMRDSVKISVALEWYVLLIYVPNLLAVVLIRLNALQLLPAL